MSKYEINFYIKSQSYQLIDCNQTLGLLQKAEKRHFKENYIWYNNQ